MVEQVLIRRELEVSRYPVPSAAEVAPVLEAFKKERFPKDEDYQSALAELRARYAGRSRLKLTPSRPLSGRRPRPKFC